MSRRKKFRQWLGLRQSYAAGLRDDMDAWLADLDALFGQLEAWLGDDIVSHRYEKTLEEDALGVYNVPALRIPAGMFPIRIEPIAQSVIGYSGRVDFTFGAMRRTLFRTDPMRWLFREPVMGGWRDVPLTSDAFWETLASFQVDV